MSYEIKLTPEAEADMKRLPLPAAFFVEQQLALLAEFPTYLSRNSYFPYPPNCQLFEFDKDFEPDKRSFFHVLFRYSPDETTIVILGIAMQVASDWWGKDG